MTDESLTITYPEQDQTVKQGNVTITGGGPSGKKVHVILRSMGQTRGEWTLSIAGGRWSAPTEYMMPGPYAVTAYLMDETRPGIPRPGTDIAVPPDVIRGFSVGV